MLQINWLIGMAIILFSGSVFADTVETQTFLWMSKDTIINSLKILAIIAFVIAVSMTVKPIRAFLYKFFLKFEIQIQKIIFFVKKFFQARIFVWILNKIILLVRLLRFIPRNLHYIVFGLISFGIAYQPGFIFGFLGENAQNNIGYIAFAIGTITFMALNAPKLNEARDNEEHYKFKKYALANLFLCFIVTVYGVYLHQKGVDAVATFTYSVSIFSFWLYSLINSLAGSKKKTSFFLFVIMLLPILTLYTGNSHFFSDTNSFLTYIAVANVAIAILLFIFQQEIDDYKWHLTLILIISLIILMLNVNSAIEFKAITNYVFATLWSIVCFALIPKTFPSLVKIFSGKAAFVLSIIWAVFALNIDYLNQFKNHIEFIDLSNFYSCLAFALLSAFAAFMNFSYLEKNSYDSFPSSILLILVLMIVSIVNMITFISVVFAIFTTINIVAFMLIISEKFNWGIKPSKAISLIALFATIIISQTLGFNGGTKYIPLISVFIFLATWIESWVKTFILSEELEFDIVYVLTLIIISSFFFLGGENWTNNVAVTLIGSWFLVSIGFFIICSLGRLHLAIGFFAAGGILYTIATLFENETIKTLIDNFLKAI